MKTYLTRNQLPGLVLMLLISLVNTRTSHAQKLIARQGGGTPTFHTSLEEAITQAVNGDTLYIPGGYFEISTPLSKKLHFVGEGHNPQSSMANGVTYINGTFTIQQEASGSSFHGLYVTPIVALGEGVKNIRFERCNMDAFRETQAGVFIEHITSNEVIFRGQFLINLKYSQFNSCIFNSVFSRSYLNCTFRNCLFLHPGYPIWFDYYNPGYASYCQYDNNIFITTDGIRQTGNSIFNNNIFVCEQTFDGSNLIGSNNIVGQMPESIFVNHTGNLFLYESDYHLKATSPGKNAGTDGKDIGLYGGPSPWKDGSVPFNPHVEFKNVAGSTNASGNLQVEIRVKSQER